MNELNFCLTISSTVYVFLQTPIGDFIRNPIERKIIELKLKKDTKWLGEKLGYLISCPFCLAFWLSIFISLFDKSYLKYCFEAAIISIIINKLLTKQIFDKQSNK